MSMEPAKRLLLSVITLLVILITGTLGFVLVEPDKGWNLLDSFYFTLITMTTIGFGEVHELSPNGKIFTILIIIFGVGTSAYAISSSAQIILEGHLNHYFGRKRMSKLISKLSNHYIICGYGRIGSYICDELNMLNFPFIIIEGDKDKISQVIENDYIYIEGDATTDDVLIQAGIERAKAVIIVVGSDAASVFITLSARGLNKDIFIMARYEQANTGGKLIKAGANKAISPHLVSGGRMVQLLLKPYVSDFLDLATSHNMIELTFEEVKINEKSNFINKSLSDSKLRSKYGVIVVGIKDNEGNNIFNPPSDRILKEGDTLIVLGNFKEINQLHEDESE